MCLKDKASDSWETLPLTGNFSVAPSDSGLITLTWGVPIIVPDSVRSSVSQPTGQKRVTSIVSPILNLLPNSPSGAFLLPFQV
jgi:bifunctional DNase/RNase